MKYPIEIKYEINKYGTIYKKYIIDKNTYGMLSLIIFTRFEGRFNFRIKQYYRKSTIMNLKIPEEIKEYFR